MPNPRPEDGHVWAPSNTALTLTLFALMLSVIIALAATLVAAPGQLSRSSGLFLMLLVVLTAWWFKRQDRIRTTVQVLMFGLWASVTLGATFGGGVRAPMVMVYPVVVVMAAMLLPRRLALWVGTLTLLAILTFVLAEGSGQLPTVAFISLLQLGTEQSLVILVSMLMGFLMVKTYQDRVAAVRRVTAVLTRRTADLESTQAELERAQSVAMVGSWVGDMATDTMRLSDEMVRIFGLSRDSRLTFARYKEFVHEDDRRGLDLAWRATLKGAPFDQEHRILVNGSVRWVRQKAALVYSKQGQALRAEGTAQDITEQKLMELALKDSEARYRTLVELTPQPVLVHREERVVYVNDAAIALFGAPNAARLLGKPTHEFIHPDSRMAQTERLKLIQTKGAALSMTEARFLRVDGTPIDVQVQGTAIVYQGQPAIQVAIHDVSALKAQQAALQRMAHFDMLTGLPNRVLLTDRLQQAMAHAKRSHQRLAVVFLDLDGFKEVNDGHGHEAGDYLLVTLAARMRHALREGDSVARMGGDEFVAVLLDLTEDSPLFARLLAAVAEPVEFNGFELAVSASLGIAFYPQMDEEQDVDAGQLLRQADQAMYQVKSKGKNGYLIFDTEQDRSLRGRHEEVSRLRQALEAREFVLHYQPKVNLRTGAVVGAEALIRWQHPDHGLRPPFEFLPLIEDHPLAVELGEWVIEAALRDQAAWRDAGLGIQVSVNVGALQLQRPDFVSRLGSILAHHPLLRPGALELEVLETSALGELAQVCQVIDDCRAIGVSMALDDFGTGYSSLTYLKRLPVATLKIDRSFVRNMLEDPDDLAILEGVISLASAFHRQVVAEGVETREHGALLLQIGCELVQGFGIARPMPSQHLPLWAATWQESPVWSDGTSD